jgi:hypothetical protein
LGAVFAFLSVFSLLALVVTALWRAELKIPYEVWHITHIAPPLSLLVRMHPKIRRDLPRLGQLDHVKRR